MERVRKIGVVVVLVVLPATALALAAAYQQSAFYHGVDYVPGFGGLLAALASLTSIVLVGSAAEIWRLRQAREADAEALRRAEEERAQLLARERRLREQVEMLSAIREIGLAANDDVDFKRILETVLRITADLFEASEVVIFLKEEGDPDLVAKAARRAKLCRFGEDLAREEPDPAFAREAYRQGRLARKSASGQHRFCALLHADREAFGALEVKVPARGQAAERLAAVEAILGGLATHVATAIRKPALYDRAVVDSLTGLYTKRHFAAELLRYFAASRRRGGALALCMVDIDHFKKVNDAHGHPAGDRVLAGVAEAIRRSIRDYDSAYRYGGEEMAVLAPGATLEEACALAERVRAVIEKKGFRTDAGEELRVTASVGVAAFRPGMRTEAELVSEADAALYQAKRGGRNRVVAGAPAAAAAPPTPSRPRERSATPGSAR